MAMCKILTAPRKDKTDRDIQLHDMMIDKSFDVPAGEHRMTGRTATRS